LAVPRRKVVEIDREKCNGCGLCIPACAEGALQIVDGKARLVADVYCDGLGACLGECPQGAITIVQREADAFDEQAARAKGSGPRGEGTGSQGEETPGRAACPGATAVDLQLGRIEPPPADHGFAAVPEAAQASSAAVPSRLGNWPVQLHLVSPHAPFLKNADLLLVADCVPFALADFHGRFLGKRPVVIGCPKLDDANFYVEKLAQTITAAELSSLTVVHMEVPCCTGLVRIAESALRRAGRELRLEDVTISIRGRVVSPGAPG
jgi:Pyruvate/2-oxoacid:ferredoxin oxidoreductase delta subunit